MRCLETLGCSRIVSRIINQGRGLTKKERQELTKRVENIVRTMRLYSESDGIYMWEPKALMDSSLSKDNAIINKLADKNLSLQEEINIVLNHLSEVSKNNKNYEFFKKCDVFLKAKFLPIKSQRGKHKFLLFY